MAFSVGVNPPKTPVTKGSKGRAKNTIPNVCKMPGPPAPFVPAPLPNCGKSELSPKGYSKNVKIEGKTVAIRGATFNSIGDMASKGTGGGLISANTHGPTKFITPGSSNVKIEGKAVHQLGEPMLNNCAASGTPPNTGATVMGVNQSDQKRSVIPDCEEARAEAQQLADQVQSLPKSQRPNKVSVVRTPGGQSAAGLNGGAVNPSVMNVARSFRQNDFNCSCAELNAISNAQSQGLNVVGSGGLAVIATVNVTGPGGKHGTKEPACSVCQMVLTELEITEC